MPRFAPASFAAVMLVMGSSVLVQGQGEVQGVQGIVDLLCQRNVTHVLVDKEEGGLTQSMMTLMGGLGWTGSSSSRRLTYIVGTNTAPPSREDIFAAFQKHFDEMQRPKERRLNEMADIVEAYTYFLTLPQVKVRYANAIIPGADVPLLPAIVVDTMEKLEGIGVPEPGGPWWSRKVRFPWMPRQARLKSSYDENNIGLFQALQENRRVAIVRPQATWERPLWKKLGAVDKAATIAYYNRLGYAACDTGRDAGAATIIFPAEHYHVVQELVPPDEGSRYWCDARCAKWIPVVPVKATGKGSPSRDL